MLSENFPNICSNILYVCGCFYSKQSSVRRKCEQSSSISLRLEYYCVGMNFCPFERILICYIERFIFDRLIIFGFSKSFAPSWVVDSVDLVSKMILHICHFVGIFVSDVISLLLCSTLLLFWTVLGSGFAFVIISRIVISVSSCMLRSTISDEFLYWGRDRLVFLVGL